MDTNYNKFFFTEYDTADYSKREYWFNFFDRIAEKIVEYFAPQTVLDAGCAMGYLVEALRERGVEAYGIDISSYAIESANQTVREFLNVQSITDTLPEGFPKKYDLVISIEVLEHLFPEDGKRALKALCSYTDTFIFTSTPDDIDDKNHLNVQQREYWAKIFAENSFYRDLVQPVDFICPWATLFRRKESVPEVIFNYELCDRIEKTREKKPKLRNGSVYFNLGDGFKADLKTDFSYYGAELKSEKISVPANCRSIRIDPIEDSFSIVSELSIATSSGLIEPTSSNADYFANGSYYFNTADPQFHCDFSEKAIAWLEISASISVTERLEDFSAITYLVEKAKNEEKLSSELSRIEEANKELVSKNLALEESNSGLVSENSLLKENNASLAESNATLAASNASLLEDIAEFDSREKEFILIKTKLEESNTVLTSEKEILTKENTDFLRDKTELEAEKKENESQIREADENIEKLQAKIKENESQIKEADEKIEKLEADLGYYKLHYNAAINQREDLKRQLDHYQLHYNAAIVQREELKVHSANLQAMYDNISNAAFWKITKPIRVVFDFIKKIVRKIPPFVLLGKFFRCLKKNGFRYTVRKIGDKLHHRQDYSAVRKPLYTPEELESQRNYKFDKDIKFSILVPLYNTPEDFLKEMIESVVGQTYSNWELCLADGSDAKHKEVGHICKKYAHSDKRIVYKKLEKNMGISLNTNACIEMASGDYIGLFDHDDLLHPAALYNVMEAICSEGADFIYTDENTFHKSPKDAYCPHFKPDYAPDTLRTNNYICHFSVFAKSLIDKVGMFRPECDGSQDYDMVLRLTEKAQKIVHIPKILYYWRAHAGSVATDISAKPYVIDAAHKALSDHLERVGLKGTVENTVVPSMYRIKYEIKGEPLISIIIANKDHSDDLRKCVTSVVTKTTYKNYEIVVVENNSTEAETWKCYDELKELYGIKLVEWKYKNGGFNYSSINNQGVEESSGDYVILLNNDIEVISPDWIQEMLMFAQRDDVGMVGAKLYYPDDTIQHAGVGIGLLTLAGHYFRGFHRSHPGYMGRLIYAHNVSAVTAACAMVPRKVWDEVGGLDESFEVAFNDIDLCMRIRKAGYLIVFTPFSEHYHYESKSRGLDSAPEKRKRFVGEVTRFQERWRKELDAGDPYYNPNFSLDKEDFSLK